MFEMYYYYYYILVFLSSFNCYVLHLLILKVVYIYSPGMCGITLQSVQLWLIWKKYVLHSLSKFETQFLVLFWFTDWEISCIEISIHKSP